MGSRSVEGGRSLSERIVESLEHAIIVVDRHERVLLANPAARVLLDCGAEVEGQEIAKLLAGAPGLDRVASPTEAGDWEEVAVEIGGEPRVLGVRWTRLAGDGGEGRVLSLTDVTRTRAAETGARRAAALAGLGRFTHHVAHELKNPIGALKLYALLLERRLRDAEADRRELIEKIGRSIEHLSSVVAGITDLGLPPSAEPAFVELARLLDECLETMAERAASLGVQVVRRHEPGVIVSADARALRPAFLGLLENALEAMPSGGALTVSCGRSGTPAAPEIEVVVRDTGAGMSERVQARLHEPFFTTKSDGTGIGMMIANQVVGQHGGRIEVRSRTGEGTAIRVVLPAR